MKSEYSPKTALIDRDHIRKAILKELIRAIDDICIEDLVCEIEQNKTIEKEAKKLGGDIYSNPKLAKFDKDIDRFTRMSIRNIKLNLKQFVPLWLLKFK